MEVTAVVACFNYGRYLPEAIGSLLGQEGGTPQVIVVDDGSTEPETHRALDALPDMVEVVRQPNGGVSRARNAGLARVRTRYALVLDADDRLAPGALRLLHEALESQPAAGFAYGHQRFFGEMEGVMRFPPYDPYRLLDRHLIGPTALMRIEMLKATGGYDPAFVQYEDWELWLNALAHGWHGVRVDAITHEYRRHRESKLSVDRRRYRALRRQMMRKHHALYADRRRLAAASDLSPLGRLVYRCFWGPRPVPAGAERLLHRVLWAPGGRVRPRGTASATTRSAEGRRA